MKRKADVDRPKLLSARPSRLKASPRAETHTPPRLTPSCRRMLLAMLEGGAVRLDYSEAGAINTLYLLRLVELLPADMMRLTEAGVAAAGTAKAERGRK